MKGKTYFIFIVFGVVSSVVWAVVIGIFQNEINSNPTYGAIAFLTFLYPALCLLLILLDAYKKHGWYAIFVAVIFGWVGPLLAIGYLVHVYLEATEENEKATSA